MAAALESMHVIEVGDFIAAPFAGKLLADLGANVVKVEPPTGDSSRRYGPFPGDKPHADSSGLFLYMNTNKFGVTLELEQGSDLLRQLLAKSDVLIHDRSAAEAERLGLTYDALKATSPRLIVIAITPYGHQGPYAEWRGHDLTTAALSAISSGMGHPDREPLAYPLFQGDHLAGVAGAIATMFAVFARRKTGLGQDVDIAETDCWATFITGIGIQDYVTDGRIKARTGHRAAHRPYLAGILPCKDGYFCLDTPQRRQWQRLLDAMGNPDWGNDPRFQNGMDVGDYYIDEVESLVTPWLLQHTKAELFAELRERRVPCAPIHNMVEVAEHPHLAAREYFVTVDHPVAGPVRMPGPPFKLSATPWSVRMPAPRLGEHNHLVYGNWLGHDDTELVTLRRSGVI